MDIKLHLGLDVHVATISKALKEQDAVRWGIAWANEGAGATLGATRAVARRLGVLQVVSKVVVLMRPKCLRGDSRERTCNASRRYASSLKRGCGSRRSRRATARNASRSC